MIRQRDSFLCGNTFSMLAPLASTMSISTSLVRCSLRSREREKCEDCGSEAASGIARKTRTTTGRKSRRGGGNAAAVRRGCAG